MAKDKTDKKAKAASAAVGHSFGGLSKSRMAQGTGFSKRHRFDQKRPSLLQFVAPPDDTTAWKEFDIHSWREDGKWHFVPCAGDTCTLCTDEDDDKRKRKYRFAAQVYNASTKEMEILEGGKDIAGRIYGKYEKAVERGKPKKFLTTVWEVSQLPTKPVSYDVDSSDLKAKDISGMDAIDLDAYIEGEIDRYASGAKPKRSSLAAKDGKKKSKSKDKEPEPPASRKGDKSKGKKSKAEEQPPAKSKDKKDGKAKSKGSKKR